MIFTSRRLVHYRSLLLQSKKKISCNLWPWKKLLILLVWKLPLLISLKYLFQLAKCYLAEPISYLINSSFMAGVFPDILRILIFHLFLRVEIIAWCQITGPIKFWLLSVKYLKSEWPAESWVMFRNFPLCHLDNLELGRGCLLVMLSCAMLITYMRTWMPKTFSLSLLIWGRHSIL